MSNYRYPVFVRHVFNPTIDERFGLKSIASLYQKRLQKRYYKNFDV